MRIDLTISEQYCKEWGVWEGLREFFQNWLDARQKGFEGKIKHLPTTNRIRLINRGVTLPRESLLLGFTTKQDDENQRGQYGEGYKLGCLGLLKAGAKIVIRTGTERWVPRIEESRKFPGQKILAFHIQTNKDYLDGVQVDIQGIDRESWDLLKDRFLFLGKKDKDSIETSAGTILNRPGQIYCMGIWVGKVPNLSHGYDFTRKDIIDRDRRMINGWDLKWNIAACWKRAMQKDAKVAAQVYQMLDEGSPELESMHHLVSCDEEAKGIIVKAFEAQHGESAVACEDLAKSRDLQFVGVKGVVVAKQLAEIVGSVKGTPEQAKERASNAIVHRYSAGDLTKDEMANLELAIETLRLAIPTLSLANAEVVDFGDPGILGQYQEGKAYIKRSELRSFQAALETGLHEWCHPAGKDGSKGFEDALVQVAAKVIVGLLNK